ncbi:MAG: hypothetical protein QXS41_03470 [Candidatus Woesearchaeota archaeon]
MLKDWTKKVNNFYLADGRIFSSLTELLRILEDISEETFYKHVNDWKNDFYEWINYCINPEIALAVKDKKNPKEMRDSLIIKLITELERECCN